MVNLGRIFFIFRVALSISGGMLWAALFLMSYGSIKDFINASKNVSPLHLWFGLLFLIVLFLVGFLSVWILYSVILWSINYLNYSIGYVVKGSRGKQKTVGPVKRIGMMKQEKEDLGDLKIESPQTEKKFIRMPIEENLKPKERFISEAKPEEPLLTREDFIRLLENSGLTINQFAEKLCVSRQMVSYIIHGKRKMTIRISDKARGIFGYTKLM